MRKQLPKFLQPFSVIPIWISFPVAFLSFMFTLASTRGEKNLFLIFIILFLVSIVSFILKLVADQKIRKLRLGVNPLYLVERHPGNLEGQIQELLDKKFELVEKDKTTALLSRRPRFSIFTALLLFLLGIVPGVVYLVYYLTLPKETVYLDLEKQQSTKNTGSSTNIN